MTERKADPSPSRRRLLGLAGGVLVGGPAATRLSAGSDLASRAQEETETETSTPTPTPPDPVWPLFQYDLLNTGAWSGGRGPVAEPGPRWGHLEGSGYISTPVVTEAEVFAADADDGSVVAVDRSTGAELWRRSVNVSAARMTIDDRTLYVPTRQSSAQLMGLDPDDGSRKWAVGLGSSANGVVSTGGSIFVSTLGGVSKVSALSQNVDWNFTGATLRETSVAVSNNGVYAAGTQHGKVVKLSLSRGSPVWSKNLEAKAQDAPSVGDNVVVVPFDKFLVAFKEESGSELWRYESPVEGSVVIHDGNVYGTTTSGEAFSVGLQNGQEHWRTPAVSGSLPPVLVGSQLYVTGTDGTLAAINPSTGSVAWSTEVGAGLSANPAVAGGELYTVDRAGRIGAFASGASGGFGEPTPTGTDTSTGSPTDTSSPTRTATPTGSDGNGGGDGGGDDGGMDVDGSSGSTPEPSTPARNDDTPGEGSELNLPLIGGAVATVTALFGGGLWWRNRQQDDYDPLK